MPERAAQQYAQALQFMKSGRNTDAELEFKHMVVGYPQFAGPQLKLGLLYLRDSRLPDAEAAFKAVLERNPEQPWPATSLASSSASWANSPKRKRRISVR